MPSTFVPSGTILVADDQTPSRELMEELLSEEGFKVIAVEDGAQALNCVNQIPVDLVVLDVMMPRLNGFEVCQKIKSNPDTDLIPVILVTALSDKQDRIDGITAGADDFLTRPVDGVELLARVRSLVKLKCRTDELERAETVLFTLARSIEGKDPYTHGHCERLKFQRRRRMPGSQHIVLFNPETMFVPPVSTFVVVKRLVHFDSVDASSKIVL